MSEKHMAKLEKNLVRALKPGATKQRNNKKGPSKKQRAKAAVARLGTQVLARSQVPRSPALMQEPWGISIRDKNLIAWLAQKVRPFSATLAPTPWGDNRSGSMYRCVFRATAVSSSANGLGFTTFSPSWASDDQSITVSSATTAFTAVVSGAAAGNNTGALIGSPYVAANFTSSTGQGTTSTFLVGRCASAAMRVRNTTPVVNRGGYGIIGQALGGDATGTTPNSVALLPQGLQKSLDMSGEWTEYHWNTLSQRDYEYLPSNFRPSSCEPQQETLVSGTPYAAYQELQPMFATWQSPAGFPQTFECEYVANVEVVGNPTGSLLPPASHKQVFSDHRLPVASEVHKTIQGAAPEALVTSQPKAHDSFFHKIVNGIDKVVGYADQIGKVIGKGMDVYQRLGGGGSSSSRYALPAPSSVTIEELTEGLGDLAIAA